MTTVEENKPEEIKNEENNENLENEKKIEIPIFEPSQIDLIYNSNDPVYETSLILQSHFRRVFLRADFNVEKIMGQSEQYLLSSFVRHRQMHIETFDCLSHH